MQRRQGMRSLTLAVGQSGMEGVLQPCEPEPQGSRSGFPEDAVLEVVMKDV